ncbi:hypothetical protein NQ318_007737 [Aromia moschata]|uniref:Uncharacterized protein n=1 Tax=Aromia moschata TaxID=1265417 RepID=A0AAV8Z1A2_9CUCU|nr:hypothetical protein NQ318_007737 [Aromia moschata]
MDDDKKTVRRQNDDDKRTVKRQKGERKSGDRRTNDDDKRTVRRQNDDDKRHQTASAKRNTGKDKWAGAPTTSYFNSRFRRLFDLTRYSITKLNPYAC